MYFNRVGLITSDQGDQFLYIPWTEIHALWEWVVTDAKPYQTEPRRKWTREQVGFILSNYEDR